MSAIVTVIRSAVLLGDRQCEAAWFPLAVAASFRAVRRHDHITLLRKEP
jgi:hypothetical protein